MGTYSFKSSKIAKSIQELPNALLPCMTTMKDFIIVLKILWGLNKPHKSATNGKKSPVLYSTQGLSLCDNSHQIFCTLFYCKSERQKDPNILYITHTLKSASIGPKSALQTLSLKSVTKGTKFHFHTISLN